MSDAVRIAKIERDSEEFGTVAIACGWDSGDHMFDELSREFDDEELQNLYLPADECGYRKSKHNLKVGEKVNILTFIGNEHGNRYFINVVDSYVDANGKLWVDGNVYEL